KYLYILFEDGAIYLLNLKLIRLSRLSTTSIPLKET
ncbi:hypothetical protein GWI33_011098, partial [Rhynchophorus ferrugineus]